MLYEIGAVFFSFVGLLLVLIVLWQRSHGGFWSGPVNNDSTIVFGGNSGSDFSQKLTWFLGFLFIFGSFGLSLYKSSIALKSKYTPVEIKNDTKINENNNLNDDVKKQDT